MTPPSEWVWGLDMASSKVAFGFVDITGAQQPWRRWNTLQLPKIDDVGIRLLALRNRLNEFVPALIGHFPPVAVIVELPTGRHPTPTLTAAWGVTTMVLRENLPDGLLLASDISPPMWKKALGLKGNADKPRCMAFARDLGYTGDDQDCADALCIAEYGARELAKPRAVSAAA